MSVVGGYQLLPQPAHHSVSKPLGDILSLLLHCDSAAKHEQYFCLNHCCQRASMPTGIPNRSQLLDNTWVPTERSSHRAPASGARHSWGGSQACPTDPEVAAGTELSPHEQRVNARPLLPSIVMLKTWSRRNIWEFLIPNIPKHFHKNFFFFNSGYKENKCKNTSSSSIPKRTQIFNIRIQTFHRDTVFDTERMLFISLHFMI